MPLDKNWIGIGDRSQLEYIRGVDDFLEFAFKNTTNNLIQCPCRKCRNILSEQHGQVRFHLLKHGFMKTYTVWYFHGEKWNDNEGVDNDTNELSDEIDYDDMEGLVNDIAGGDVAFEEDVENLNDMDGDIPNNSAAMFYGLLQEAKEKVYPGCQHSKLGAIVKLLHLKSLHRWTNHSFDALMEFLGELVPEGKKVLPSSFNDARKYIAKLGLTYEKYDVCENNCTMYWGSNADATSCSVCHSSRWKIEGRDGRKNIPHKTARYFPITPRLQRLYMSSKTATEMRWHKEKRIDDGIMRHPADSPAWKALDEQDEHFANDSRSVRLALATDGFQPFGNLSSQHSIWPIVVVPLNLPPWMCMKQPSFIMSMLIPGPHSPGMGIDVFLQPLVEELKLLWNVGVETYDADSGQNFTLRAAILWTINDFPALADVSGWSTKGYMACPSCHKNTCASYLSGSKKLCYLGHRRFLPTNHKWRKNTTSFDGTRELRGKPEPLKGDDILREISSLNQIPFGRGIKRKYDDSNSLYNWRKKSILFELPYWKMLLIRYNLDVMHIEKNVCDNVLGTIMNIKEKTKDTLNSRYDLVSLGIRSELHPFVDGNKKYMPPARYTLSNVEKEVICNMLKELRTPDGYLSKISRCVNVAERKISGLKSHDCHIFIQRLLPLCIRGFLPKEICEALMELSVFLRDLCSKVLDPKDLDRLEKQIVLTLCKLEMIFPPSFFDVMVHLLVHLPNEAKIGGPVQYRWMYAIERYLRTLKGYVRNKARPEGSIAEAYIVDECLTFCSIYLEGIETKFNVRPRNDHNQDDYKSCGLEIFDVVGRTMGKETFKSLNHDWRQVAHTYVLNNCQEVWPFIEEYKNGMPRISQKEFLKRYNAEFSKFFHNRVAELYTQGSASDNLLHLAEGPSPTYKSYTGYIANGFRFHTLDRQRARRSQNSGILCKGDESSPEKEYYGMLEEVWELQYPGRKRVHIFKCLWFDVHHKGSGYKIDNYSVMSVQKNRQLKTNEPFILASQAEQVFYVEDPKDCNWLVVMKTQPRDLYCMPSSLDHIETEIEVDNEEAFQQEDGDNFGHVTRPLDEDEEVQLDRNDVPAEEIPLEFAEQLQNQLGQNTNDEILFNDSDLHEINDIEEQYNEDDFISDDD